MTNFLHYLCYAFITLGVFFNLLAAVSLLRFSDVYSRLLSSTKGITFGTLSILFGVFLMHGFNAVGVKSLLCLFFILLTSPIETQVLLRAAKKSEANKARQADGGKAGNK